MKKTSKQVAKMSLKKKLYTEDDKKLLKTQEKQIKKNKKKNSKVHIINNLKNSNAAIPSEKRHYSQIDECFILLTDCFDHKKYKKSDKSSTGNNTKNISENDKDYSSKLKTKEQNIKKIKKENSKVQNMNSLINDNAVAHTKKRHYSQIDECFILLTDCFKHKKNKISDKSSTGNNTKNISENDKDFSSMLKAKEQNIKKKKREDSKVQNINSLINDNAVAHTKKRHYSQIDECFVLLSDCFEHKKNKMSDNSSTGNNTKNISENDKDYSSILKPLRKNIKNKNKIESKVQKKNNLIKDNAVAHTKKRQNSQMNECFVLLADCNEHKKNHKSHKTSTYNNTKKSAHNDKDYSLMFKTKEQNIKKIKKEDSKVQNIYSLINDNAVAHEKKHSQIDECFVLLSDCYEHKKNHKSDEASTRNNTKNSSSKNDKEYSSMLKTKEQNIKKKKREDSKVQNINDNAVAHTKKRHSQIDECFVLLSDCNEHKKNHKSDKVSTRNNTKSSSENDKDNSSIFKTRGKKIKINNKLKVQKINNLENDNAAIHTKKQHSQLKECFVLLSDFNKNKKIIHKPNKASRKKIKIGSENNKEYLSMSKISNKFKNENAAVHTEKINYNQIN